MFIIPTSKHAKKVDVGLALYNQILEEKGDDFAEQCVADCKSMQKLRGAFDHEANGDTGKALLRYLGGMQLIQGVDLSNLKVEMLWTNAFDGEDTHSSRDIDADKMGAMFNMGICEAVEARSKFLGGDHGSALKGFEQAGGWFKYAAENVFDGTWDVRGGCLRCLTNCMLGNAQMVFYENAKQKYGSHVMSMLVAGAGQFYTMAENEVDGGSSIGKQARMMGVYCKVLARELQAKGFRETNDMSNALTCLTETIKEAEQGVIAVDGIEEMGVEELKAYCIGGLENIVATASEDLENAEEENRLFGCKEAAKVVADVKALTRMKARNGEELLEQSREEGRKKFPMLAKMFE